MAKKASSKKTPPVAASKKTAKKAARTATTGKGVKEAVRKTPAGETTKSKTAKKTGAKKNGAPTKAMVRKFRQMLLDKRRDMVGDMNGLAAETLGAGRNGSGDLSNMPTHPADIGTDNFEHEFSLGLLESERQMLTEIDEALERIEEGTYGVCLGTGRPIGAARLRARPWAKYCIDYARKVEKGLVRPGENDDDDDEDTGP